MIRKAIIVDLTHGGGYADNFKLGDEVFVKFFTYTVSPRDGDLWEVSHDGSKWFDAMYGKRLKFIEPEVHSVTAVPEVSITRKRLTIDKIGVGQTFIIHGQPETVYVKISNSHVFNHKRLQMHTTVAERFKQHLNLVAVELVVYNGK